MSHNRFSQPQRVAVYIDGFNLQHALRERNRRYLWLDLWALGNRLLRPRQTLAAVKLFTAPVRNADEELRAHKTYWAALRAGGQVEVVLGRFQEKHVRCRVCGGRWRTYEEKETDVSLAISMIEDAVDGQADKILLVSGDSDFRTAVRSVRRLNPGVGVIVVFPPGRQSEVLGRAAHGRMFLGLDAIRQSQFPESVPGVDGMTYTRPKYWS
ncbi:NYN domain-containing protein [Spongiactinospora sp. TRM90649]|uniref:NYN domain-containing protein n=1 Tax=Spongiactinospora sp. TRM90649 TaxID=3031114 RepID=UPI0023F668AD|nr:NYN domain-containing protein [Spongiactinospora sp. TRM90649]MDF5754776.1 NYN domain-containing protein [Spongiactinospora sp. TRM90649]